MVPPKAPPRADRSRPALQTRRGFVLAEHLSKDAADFADCRVGFDRLKNRRQQILLAQCGVTKARKSRADGATIPLTPERLQAPHLGILRFWVTSIELQGLRFALVLKAVDPNDDPSAGLYLLLVRVRLFLDRPLHVATLDRFYRPPGGLDRLQLLSRPPLELVGEGLDVIGTGHRVHCVRRSALVGDDLLGPKRDPLGPLRRERQRLVKAGKRHRLHPAQ